MARTRYFGGSSLPYRFKNVPKNVVARPAAAPASSRPFPAGLVAFSSGKERCGINEYSKGLSAQMRLQGATVSEHLLSDVSLIASAGAGAEILVHAEPSIVPQGIYAALKTSRSRGAKVVVCFHYCEAGFMRPFAEVADVLVTHREYGISNPKIRVVPLGCPLFEPPGDLPALRRKYGLPEGKALLTYVGFLSAWKRTPDLVQQLLPELERRGAVLQLICPTHFSGDPTGEVAKMRRLTENRPTVIWISNFPVEAEVLERAACSDLGIAYHGQNTGSVSATNKMLVAARVPLLVTCSTHDSDHAGAEHTPSFDLVAYARRAAELAHDRAALARLREGSQRDYDRMNQIVVARRYLELFKEIKR